MLVFAVDAHLLWQVIWVSFVAGVGVSLVFSLVILAGARASDHRRAGRDGTATLYGVLAIVAALIFLAGVVIGVQVMLTK